MRVLHVIPSLASRYGGPSVVIRPMAQALNGSSGIKIEIATTDADGPYGRVQQAEFDCGPVPVHVFRRSLTHWTLSAGLWNWLRKNVSRFDLLHVHTLWNFPTAAACNAARAARCPYIIRPCGMLSQYTWNRSPARKRFYWKAIERRNFECAKGFHATSGGEAEDIGRLKLDGCASTFTIPLGMDPAAWGTECRSDRLRSLCGVAAKGRPIVLYLSRVHPKKGITDVLLPAMACMKADAFLAIVGGVDERTPNHGAEIQAEAQRLGVASRIRLLGRVASQDRWAMFDGADAFVLPSHSENFGNVIMEAMARGLPVVTTDGVQGAGHILTAGSGLVVPIDPLAVARGLDSLLADPLSAKAAGEAGRRYVRENLNWSRIAAHIEAMYHSCLS